MRKMSKAVRIRRLLLRGASTEQIVKATGSSKQYVYTIHGQMKKETQEKEWAKIQSLAKTGITSRPLPEDFLLASFNEPPKTMWQKFVAFFKG